MYTYTHTPPHKCVHRTRCTPLPWGPQSSGLVTWARLLLLRPAQGTTEPTALLRGVESLESAHILLCTSLIWHRAVSPEKRHHHEIRTEPPLGWWVPHATVWKVSWSRGLPRPQASWEGALRPQGRAGQASNCLWMQMHWVGSRRAGRQFLEGTGCARPRTYYWEGARKRHKWVASGSLRVPTLGNRSFRRLLRQKSPRAPPWESSPVAMELTSLSVNPPCTGERSSPTAGKNLARLPEPEREPWPPSS